MSHDQDNPESQPDDRPEQQPEQQWTPPQPPVEAQRPVVRQPDPEPGPTDTSPTQQLPPYAPQQYPSQQYPAQQYPAQQYESEPTATYPQYGGYPQPAAHRETDGSRGARVPGWTWPAIVALTLVVGVLAGVLGSAVERELNGSDPRSVTRVTAPPLEAGNTSVAAVAAELLPSTVQVLARDGGAGGTGSGFVLDDDGHVVTNNHVIADAVEGGEIQVVDSTGTVHEAELVGRSPVYDLAVLRVGDTTNLTPAATGAAQELLVGDGVVAFGAPLGLQQTVTAGIVSALNRPVTTGSSSAETSFINAVQTDAAINPGNSGGPLVNLSGQVVGVNTAIATTGGFGESGNIGVGFAIPIEQVLVTAEQILDTGESRYPVVGATVDTSRTDSREGARITSVNNGSPAAAAGIRADDVVTALEGVPVTNGISLIVQIRTHRPGDRVEVAVRRGSEDLTFDVVLGSEVG